VRKILAATTAALAVLAALWFGHAPPRSVAAYSKLATQTVEYLHSQVQTARLWAGAVARGDATHQAAVVALDEAESDAGATADRFAGWDPPSGADGIRDTVTSAGDEVTEALARLRIAAHRDQWSGLPQLAGTLPDLAQRLDDLRRELTR
jgi:hypothetical protein